MITSLLKISLAKFWAVNCTIRKIIIMYFITTICQYVEVTVFWLFIQSTIQKKDLGVVLLIREKDQVNSYCTIGKIWGLPLVVLSQCSSFIPGTQVRLRTRAKTYFFFSNSMNPQVKYLEACKSCNFFCYNLVLIFLEYLNHKSYKPLNEHVFTVLSFSKIQQVCFVFMICLNMFIC